MARHRVALIGLGMAVTPHALALQDLAERVEVAAAFSPSAERRRAFAARFGFPLADDLDAVLADPRLDAVLLLTPPRSHLELVARCAAAGKHVLLEKPLEATVDRAAELVDVAERAGIVLGVVLQHRHRPAALRLRQLVDQGALGALVSAAATVRWWRDAAYFAEPGRGTLARDGGGVLLTQAIHTLDLFLSLTPPVEEVTAFAATSALRRIDTEDVVAAALRFAGGAIGAVDATTVAYPGFPETIELAGTEATARLAADALELYWKDGRREQLGGGQGFGGGADPMAFAHDAHRGVLAGFLDALDGMGAPRPSGREALAVHRLIDAVLRSSAERRPVALSH